MSQGPAASRLHGMSLLTEKSSKVNLCSLKLLHVLIYPVWFFDFSVVEEHFLRQFCDAHTCTGKNKPFPRGGKVKICQVTVVTYLCVPNEATCFIFLSTLKPIEKTTFHQFFYCNI